MSRHNPHGMKFTPEYESWCRAKARCYNSKNNRYKSHGARGIIMCPEWKNSFEQFYKDMGPRPYGFSIERKDNNGNYEPKNCIWANAETQSRNRRSCRFVSVLNKTMNVRDAEILLGIHRSSINQKTRQCGMTYQQVTNHFIMKKLDRNMTIVNNSIFILNKALSV